MVLGGLRRDLAAALELGHQRVVARELLELAVAEAVGAAVAHVGEADLVAVIFAAVSVVPIPRWDSSDTARS